MYTWAEYKAQRAAHLSQVTKIHSHTVTLNTITAVSLSGVSLSNSMGANISAPHCYSTRKLAFIFNSKREQTELCSGDVQ